MLNELATIAKTKLWLGTVNKYKEFEARRKLAAYVKTLSPEKQAWANDLRARLEAEPERSAPILRKEIEELNVKHARLAEKLHAVTQVTN